MRTIKNHYNPDYSVHPGEILEETLQARGMSKTHFARLCNISTKQLNQIIKGKLDILPEVAIIFGKVLGVPANFWNSLQLNYNKCVYRLR